MANTQYFYEFIQPISPELAKLAQELERSIFVTPRSMLAHSRIFIENIIHLVSKSEGVKVDSRIGNQEHIRLLDEKGILTQDITDDLHMLRMIGNKASHDPRSFRISEALIAWETLYRVVKWYVEAYGPVDLMVPDYVDPIIQGQTSFEVQELEERMSSLEELLKKALQGTLDGQEVPAAEFPEEPGFTTIRKITYKDEELEVPYFLRDAFLLPQRFDKSELFLIRLGGAQEARLISELPSNLDGLHTSVKRFSPTNDEEFFRELGSYIEEEKQRHQIKKERPGELFFFYKSDYIVVTEHLAEVRITEEEFTGFPNFVHQLNDQGYYKVGQLPKELVTLGKYKRVGKGTLEKFFHQLKRK